MLVFSRAICKNTSCKCCHCFRKEQKQSHIFIPFAQLQEQKLLESRLVSVLHNSTDLNQIKQVHACIYRKGLEQCSFVITKLIRMLTKLNIPLDAYPRLLFQQVEHPNSFLWTALIRGYALNGPFIESIVLYNSMRRVGTRPVSYTFSAVFKGCNVMVDVNLGRQLHGQMMKIGGFESDVYVGNTLIDMYLKCGVMDCGRKMFDEMPERDIISWTSLIVAYARTGEMEAARELFDELPAKDMVVWTAMVTGYAQNARPGEALQFFERMQISGVGTDGITLVGVISACAQLGATKYASWVRDIAEKSGLGPNTDVVIGSAFIDMYSKCGMVENAYEIFQDMTEKNVYSYSSMILGFAMHGHANAAMELFHVMLKTEIKPNRVTLIGVLTACSHAGLVEEGRHFFSSMHNSYGVEPSADHYTCMVDLLGRVGCLEEALDLVKSMPVEPHGGVWGALLGACRIHRNPDIAEIAAGHLFVLEPNSIGNYVLLSNILASAGRWDGVSRVRKLMRTKHLKKNPGCSWVEGKKGIIHEFYSGDMTHPKSREIKQALEDLLDKLKLEGYQPNLASIPYDVSDDEKKWILMFHSEKLALAFGLITMEAGSSIRIMKNLRICEDCHMVMCGASKIIRREIIIRDSMRFHYFHDGECSCRNFW